MALISTDFERWLINRPSCSSLLTPSHPPPSVHCQPFETSMGGVADCDNSLSFSVSRFPRRARISARIRYPVWRNPICPAPQPRVQVILFGPLKGWGRLEGIQHRIHSATLCVVAEASAYLRCRYPEHNEISQRQA